MYISGSDAGGVVVGPLIILLHMRDSPLEIGALQSCLDILEDAFRVCIVCLCLTNVSVSSMSWTVICQCLG